MDNWIPKLLLQCHQPKPLHSATKTYSWEHVTYCQPVRLVGGWYWFVLRVNYWWLIASGWFVLR
jgi:hypothetical protein